ncbi:MAG: hypothetical protein ATN32_00995 [Candidatus Epulonipiscium fishelsonii]|nr:MAG: hypothetical protein ATN32_00995 [Epulopiscium sp. AS2M-Bin002]
MRDKISGTIYGMALGDAMGMPSELWGINRIKNFFGTITTFLDGPKENEVACNYTRGQFTDDTSQALIILDSLLNTKFIPNKDDIGARLLDWAIKEDAVAKNILGPTSKAALTNLKENVPTKHITDKSLSNGSAMRISPIGCLFNPDDKEKMAKFIYEVSSATHTSDVTIAGAAMIAMAVSSSMVNSDMDKVIEDVHQIEKIAKQLGAETFSASLMERTKIGIEIARNYEGEEFLQKIYDIVGTGVNIIESVPAALAIAYYAKDPNISCLLCANLGGDTDTIGAMSTAICGALKGKSFINSEYIKILEANNDINFENYIDILLEGRNSI